MNVVSLCMIVKNEQKTLARCLNSIKKFVDEIVIVDTGSTDSTKQIAKKYTNKIYDFEWCNDFSKARNYAFSLASGNYIMWLDADDVVPNKTLKNLIAQKQKLDADVYMLKYDIAFNGKKATFSYYRERIIKNCPNAVWNGVVHECISPFGKVEKLNISIWHKKEQTETSSKRNLNIYQNLHKTRPLEPREKYYFGRELFDHKKYKKCIKILTEFVNSGMGWKENIIDALFLISICYKNLNQNKQSLNALFSTFSYDTPRANVCCHIGNYFFETKNYQTAVFWYTQASKCKDVTPKGGFVQSIYYNYYPYLQLCCCYYNLNNFTKAYSYNKKAQKYLNTETVIKNNLFFEKILK